MDLNHINLPAFVVADLYHSSLVESNNTDTKIGEEKNSFEKNANPDLTVTEDPVTTDWKYLGENRKNILIVVSHSDLVHLPDEDFNFLTGILGACKLGIRDVAIVNFNNYAGSYKELITYFNGKNVFLFGIEPAAFGLPISFPHFQVQSFANNSFLFSPELKELENDKVLKSKLWVCLKRIFGI